MITNVKKYITVQKKATESNGASAGKAPKQVREQKSETKSQKTKRETGEN